MSIARTHPPAFRIGIDARLYGVASGTGIGRYVEELVAQLTHVASGDPTLTFVVFLRSDAYDAFTCPSAQWEKVRADFRPYSIAAQTQYPRVLRDARLDLMHFTHFDHPRTYRAPFIVTIHDLILLHHPSVRASTLGPLAFRVKFAAYQRILDHAVFASARILTPSATVAREIAETFDVLPERIIPTHLGIDHHSASSRAGHSAAEQSHRTTPRDFSTRGLGRNDDERRRPYLLYIGNAYPHKNVEQLLRVLPDIRAHIPGMELVLVGRTDDFSRALATKVAHGDGVTFAGAVNDEERTQLLRSATAYVTASRDEGFALPPVEALAVDTPVIASDIPIHREILGTCATYFPQNDDRALVRAVCSVAASRDARAIVEGRKRASQYTWRTCALQTLSAYREVAALLAQARSTP